MKNSRRAIQFAVLALTLIGVFYLHANAECWCPFGGIEALYTYAHEGNLLCSLGISNFYALAALVVSVLLVRRAFCGYLCPIGTISEWLRVLADRLGVRGLRAPAKADRSLSLAKYLILTAIVIATWQAGELVVPWLLSSLRAAGPTRGRHHLLGVPYCGNDCRSLFGRCDAVLPLVMPAGSRIESAFPVRTGANQAGQHLVLGLRPMHDRMPHGDTG